MYVIKKNFCLFLSVLFVLQIPNVKILSADFVEEYIPDERFILSSRQIRSLIGTNQKFDFRLPNSSDDPLARELFPTGMPSPNDIEQGKFRNCYLMAAFSSIVEKHPEIITNAIKDNHDGTVTVKIFDILTSEPRLIKVQKTLPNLPRCCKLLGKECLWINMFLKALIGANLSQRGCFKIFSSMNYEDIEDGFASSALKMITGKECEHYNDLALMSIGKINVFKIIKEATSNGSGIVTCDFNHNRFLATLHGFLPLSSSDGGLVYGHIYSVIGTYEDSLKEKWIRIRNPWHGFSATYDIKGKRYVNPDDSKSEGYFDLKLEDFYKCCGSLQIVKNDKLKPLNTLGKIREKLHTPPARLLITALSCFLCEYLFTYFSSLKMDNNIRIIIYPLLAILWSLILWE